MSNVSGRVLTSLLKVTSWKERERGGGRDRDPKRVFSQPSTSLDWSPFRMTFRRLFTRTKHAPAFVNGNDELAHSNNCMYLTKLRVCYKNVLSSFCILYSMYSYTCLVCIHASILILQSWASAVRKGCS